MLDFELCPGSRGQARPGQAAAPGTLYNDVESLSSELVLDLQYFLTNYQAGSQTSFQVEDFER